MSNIVSNVKVYGLYESIVGSGYPMLSKPYNSTEFISECEDAFVNENSNHKKRIIKLAQTNIGEGHDNALNGALVQFDLNFTVKAWTEAERYHFLDFVSSMSSMHRLTKMDMDTCFCDYVTENSKNEMKRLLKEYNDNPSIETKLALLYNCPTGLQLTARMTTNYRQLKTIYRQRKNHTLPEWREFCKWIETLPYSELITCCKDDTDKDNKESDKPEIDSETLEKINLYSRRNLTADDVYVFDVVLCDNEIDEYNEKLSKNALTDLALLFIGKTGSVYKSQTARIVKTELITVDGKKTSVGESYTYLKGTAFILRTIHNKSIIDKVISKGKKDVSISFGCFRKHSVYDKVRQQDFTEIDGATDVYDWNCKISMEVKRIKRLN
jgi:hypothetical protein